MTNKRVARVYPVAEVLDVHDGDTLKLDVDAGFSTLRRVWVRLKNVHAPELRDPAGPQARADVIGWMNEHAPDGFVEVTTFWSQGSLKEINEEQTFVRYVAVVKAPNGAELNSYLLAKGYVDRGMSIP